MKLDKSDLQVETLVSRIKGQELDLQPDFQRGEVWDLRRQQRLIDTILREWYVPAIHIVVDSEGNDLVLDGQQRLAAIRDFLLDRFPVDGTIEPYDDRVAKMHGKLYSALDPQVQRAVRRFPIQVVTLSDYEPQEPNELFFRLNQSYNLTPPEKRNALHGPARDQVKRLVTDLKNIGLLERSSIGFSNGRLAYDDIIARSCVAIEANSLRRHINNDVVERFYRSDEFSRPTIGRVETAGHTLLGGIRAADRAIKFNKGTLQSWLLYCCWASERTGQIPTQLLADFDSERDAQKGVTPASGVAPQISELVRIYNDRASYRVTDVSSVLSRDLVIHLYSQYSFSTPSHLGSDELLAAVLGSPVEDVQGLVSEYIDSSGWGEPLLPAATA